MNLNVHLCFTFSIGGKKCKNSLNSQIAFACSLSIATACCDFIVTFFRRATQESEGLEMRNITSLWGKVWLHIVDLLQVWGWSCFVFVKHWFTATMKICNQRRQSVLFQLFVIKQANRHFISASLGGKTNTPQIKPFFFF